MRGDEFLDKLELVDPAYVEAADTAPKTKKSTWLKWGAIAACLCIVVGIITITQYFRKNQTDPRYGEIILSDNTTARVSYGYEEGAASATKGSLKYLTEEELFSQERMYAFRGKVSGLTNITIDFNGVKEARCVATIVIDEVYRGNIIAGQQITMLLPCAIDVGDRKEDTGVISRIEYGMEGIFMPRIYNDASCWEQNGAKLILKDIAVCGLMDGMRWAFLSMDDGVVFERDAYPGAKNARDLEDIEAYIIEKLG